MFAGFSVEASCNSSSTGSRAASRKAGQSNCNLLNRKSERVNETERQGEWASVRERESSGLLAGQRFTFNYKINLKKKKFFL